MDQLQCEASNAGSITAMPRSSLNMPFAGMFQEGAWSKQLQSEIEGFLNGSRSFQETATAETDSVKFTFWMIESAALLLVIISVTVAAMLCQKKQSCCVYAPSDSRLKRCLNYGLYLVQVILILVFSMIMYDRVMFKMSTIDNALCGVKDYSTQLVTGVQSSENEAQWAGLQSLSEKVAEAEAPMTQVFDSYQTLFANQFVNENFVAESKQIVSNWINELKTWRNQTVSNFKNTQSILLQFSDQSYENSRRFYPMEESGTVLHSIQKNMNETAITSLEMIQIIQDKGSDLKDQKADFLANLKHSADKLVYLVGVANTTQKNFMEKGTQVIEYLQGEKDVYAMTGIVVFVLNGVCMISLAIAIFVKNQKYHLANSVLIIAICLTSTFFLTNLAVKNAQFLNVSNQLCVYNSGKPILQNLPPNIAQGEYNLLSQSCQYKDERAIKELLELEVLNQHQMFNDLKDSSQTFINSPEGGDFNAVEDFNNTLDDMVAEPPLTRFATYPGDQETADLVQPSAQVNIIKGLRTQDLDVGQGLCAVRLKNDHLVIAASHCPSGTRVFYNQTYYDENIQPGETGLVPELSNKFCFVFNKFSLSFWVNRYNGLAQECVDARNKIDEFLQFQTSLQTMVTAKKGRLVEMTQDLTNVRTQLNQMRTQIEIIDDETSAADDFIANFDSEQLNCYLMSQLWEAKVVASVCRADPNERYNLANQTANILVVIIFLIFFQSTATITGFCLVLKNIKSLNNDSTDDKAQMDEKDGDADNKEDVEKDGMLQEAFLQTGKEGTPANQYSIQRDSVADRDTVIEEQDKIANSAKVNASVDVDSDDN